MKETKVIACIFVLVFLFVSTTFSSFAIAKEDDFSADGFECSILVAHTSSRARTTAEIVNMSGSAANVRIVSTCAVEYTNDWQVETDANQATLANRNSLDAELEVIYYGGFVNAVCGEHTFVVDGEELITLAIDMYYGVDF